MRAPAWGTDSRRWSTDYLPTAVSWILTHTLRGVRRTGQLPVGTEHVVRLLLRVCPVGLAARGQTRRGVAAAVARWRPDGGVERPDGEGLWELTDAATADLREATSRLVTPREGTPERLRELWTGELVAAVRRAAALAGAEGVWRPHAVHLLRAVLADEASRGVRALASAGVGTRFAGLDIPDDLPPREALPDTAVVPYLDRRGWIRPHAAPPYRTGVVGRLRWRWAALRDDPRVRPMATDILLGVYQEAIRNAVRLGHRATTSAHVVVGLAALEHHLSATGQQLRSRAASLDAAGRLLREHGIDYRAAYETAALTCADLATTGERWPRIDGDVERRTWQLWQRLDAAGLPYAGTTAVLHAHLAGPEGSAAAVVRALGVSPSALESTALRHLYGAGPRRGAR